MFRNSSRAKTYRAGSVMITAVSAGLLLGLWSCNNAGTPAQSSNTFINDAIGFQGSLTGKVADSQTTRQSIDGSAAQALPPRFDPTTTRVRFKDLDGNDLVGADGQPIADVSVDSTGAFTAEGLPVGTDFTVCGDFNNDGTCDVESSVNIPAEVGGTRGRLDDIQSDPLTTLVLAKLRQLMTDLGIKPEELPFSPAALAARVVDSYVNLFEDAGVDQTLTLDTLQGLNRDQLATLFDDLIPTIAATGIKVAEGNLQVVKATDAQELAVAVAKVFLQAGFPIADEPDGPDLSALGNLDNVTITTEEALYSDNGPFNEFDGPMDNTGIDPLSLLPPDIADQLTADLTPGELDALLAGDIPPDLQASFPPGTFDDLLLGVAQVQDPTGPVLVGKRVYISTITEPDRNFGGMMNSEGNAPMLPLLTDRVLVAMARLQLEGRTISIADLYDLLTSVNDGLGVRMVFELSDPNFFGPPRTIFETADGNGKAINLGRIFSRLSDAGLENVDAGSFDGAETNIRSLVSDLLNGTVPPTFARLFGAISFDRLPGIEELAQKIRDARVHLPFNGSGPSTFFVVADGDPFRGDGTGKAITVDADITVNGEVRSITLNATGEGKYYLGFTQGTDERGIVELIVRETGRFVHGKRGPARISLFDDAMFSTSDGSPFSSVVSTSGAFFPGTSVSVIRTDFAFDRQTDTEFGLNEQLFVLASGVSESAEPVRVDYDPTTGIATFNPEGRSLLAFQDNSEQTGVFALFNEDTGRFASANDPTDLFGPPPEQPLGFDDMFNDPVFNDPALNDPNFVGGTTDPMLDGTTMADPTVTPGNPTTVPAQVDPTLPAPPPPPAPGIVDPSLILIAADQVVGLQITQENFSFVFGTEVPNPNHNADADPYFDDVNGNGVQDPGEPTAPFRPTLFDPNDWRSTDIRLYYRRADNGASIGFDEASFDAATPQTIDGVALVARNYIARLNAFRFGRPNAAINLLTAFAPTNFFDGTHGLTRDTRVDIFMAIALINLTMDQIFNTEANIDIDGQGPLPKAQTLVEAHLFVAPINDPLRLLAKGFGQRSEVRR